MRAQSIPLKYQSWIYTWPVLFGIGFGLLVGLLLEIMAGRPALAPKDLFVWQGFGAVAVLAARVLWVALRQGRVRVEWDDTEIRELDGDAVRIAIPWNEGKAWSHAFKARMRNAPGVFQLTRLRFVAPSGDVIDLTNVDSTLVHGPGKFRVYARDALEELRVRAEKMPKLAERPVDPRDRIMLGRWWARWLRFFLSLAMYAALTLFVSGTGLLHNEHAKNLGLDVRFIFSAMFIVFPLVQLLTERARLQHWLRQPVSHFVTLMQKRARLRVRVWLGLIAVAFLYPQIAGAVVMGQRDADERRLDEEYRVRELRGN